MIRVLVCGGRKYENRERLFSVMDALHAEEPIVSIVHGASLGADALAEEWAKERGVDSVSVPAQWTKYGRAAGPIRNRTMLHEQKPDLVIAFPGGSGTAHMVEISRYNWTPVLVVK